MRTIRWTLARVLLVALAACGGKHNTNEGFDGGSSSYALTLVGGPLYTVHPQDKRILQVLLSQDQVGPVPSAGIHFEFQDGDPAGAKLDAQDVTTDANGIATVHFTAGSAAGKPIFKVVASAPSYDAGPVAVQFNVIPIRTMLQVVATATTHLTSPDGSAAATLIGVNSSVALKVHEFDLDTGAPIAKDNITFTLPPNAATVAGAPYWSAGGATAASTTSAGGDAQVFLLTKGDTSHTWLVTAAGGGTGSGVSFTVTVQASTGASCTTNSQCGPGQVCIGDPPTCQPAGTGGGCDDGSDDPCPNGYVCQNGVCTPLGGGQCDPAAPNCGSGQCCNAGTLTCINECPSPCATGSHCQPSATCGQGTCVTDNTVPDVTGVWLTRHTYSIRDALPTVLQDVFYAIRLIDQALLGKLTITGIPWIDKIINAIVSKLLQQYLPDWLQQVIHISDDIVTVLSDLRSEGSMRLSRIAAGDLAHVKGTEVWTSLVFYWLPLCNGNIGGDPCQPPVCARIDLATTDSENPGEVGQCKGQSLPSITVQVKPFTASVVGTGTGGGAPYRLNVDERQVDVKMGKVILVLIDTLISFVTPYHCIEEITDCTPGPGNCPLIDCYGLGQDVESATGGLVPAGTIESICDGVVTAAGKTVTDLLATAWPLTADVLDFTGHASVSGAAGDPSLCDGGGATCAAQLGNADYDKDLGAACFQPPKEARDGYWTGDFFFKVLHKLPGAWEATRPQ
ncbi:MAG: hypothetical protein LC689_14885 [Myxococcales bacterium]|nr:hypothetical protein [Myxococcales bacterium]